jgi:hypothetical protein
MVTWALAGGVVLAATQEPETQRQYLSGRGKDDAVRWRFLCTTGAQSGFWTNIPVPANWELHGFGHLNYKKDSTNAWTEQGLYEHDFTVPAEWSGKRTFLVFEGAMTDTSAKLNGEPVGPTHQGGFYRFKHEVTRLLKPGATNRLEATVAKHSANESVNKAERLADYWVFGGIYRPVYLEAVPPQFIERVAIDARHDGALVMEVFANGITSADSEMVLEAQVADLNGKATGPALRVQQLSGDKATLKAQIPTPRAWTAETPNLYRVEVRLLHGRQLLHRHSERFGFRTMEVRENDGLYLNGRRVILKGVNRHSFWPDSGRCLSEAVHRLDIATMKDMNVNAVRMSHYPPDAEFLDLCDELGLYVLDELAGWHNHYDDTVGRKLVREMVTRDVNHPSVLFWDNGNEGGFNTNLDQVFLEFDPQQRRVLHPWATFSGINTTHYLAYDKAEAACAGFKTYYADGKEHVVTNHATPYIYMPTEFLHGLYDGGAGAGLEDYWRLMTASRYLGGGFLWVFCDEAVRRPDTGELDTAGNQAPDGIVGPYREREGSFYAIKELWSPIQVRRESDGTFRVKNHYSFTHASQCRFSWQLRRHPWPAEARPTNAALAQAVIAAPPIPPGGEAPLPLPLPEVWREADVLALRVDDPGGRELRTWTWPMPRSETLQKLASVSSRQAQFGGDIGDALLLKYQGLTVGIGKQTGLLASVDRNGARFSLCNGPRPGLGDGTLKSIMTSTVGGDVLVTATFDGNLREVVWRLRGDGWLQCDFRYAVSGPQDFLGVLFDYPEKLVTRKRWLGDGPFRVWKNRLGGVALGLWETDYNDTITGHRGWIYPEFKGCFSGVRWMQLETAEGLITFIPHEGIPYVQVLSPDQPPDSLVANTRVNLPRCGLGFLHGIPAIGTKFKPAAQGGPQGRSNLAGGEYSGSVNFYFGNLR